MPRQPFMVNTAPSYYYKKTINEYGISHFYTFQTDREHTQIETSVPDGCTDIIFHYDKESGDAGAYLYGSPLTPHAFELLEGYTYFGVRFLPGNSPITVDVSTMADVINQVIPYKSIADDGRLPESIAVCPDFESQVALFLRDYLRSQEKEEEKSSNFTLKQYLLNTILGCSGNIRIEKLAKCSGYSVRYINRIFKDEIGISPKTFSRIVRFQKCLNDMSENAVWNAEMDMEPLLGDLGYSDQSHMIREFKEFSKRTPIRYLEELKKFDYAHRLKVI